MGVPGSQGPMGMRGAQGLSVSNKNLDSQNYLGVDIG